ncbi:MAG: DUF983 domain-containing protein [Actinomycetota bacterium]|nr:DUF983 domain-containing protein [Actinomycetota bacterium]
MTRTVRAAGGRVWKVSSSVNWSEPETAQDFEHDVAASGHAVAMLVLVVVLLLTVVIWTPEGVVVPTWLVLAFLMLLLILAVLWATGRSRTIVAETPGRVEMPPERWVCTVHGTMLARQHVTAIARTLEYDGMLDDGSGPLEQVNCGPLRRVY